MLSANRTQIGEQISAVTQQLIFLALATAADIDKEDRRLPDDNVDPLVIELFAYLVMWYKEDTEGLLKKYREGGLWKAAIRKQLGMDDPDEKGYWYYHVYREKPNVLFSIYFEEHPAIALEKLLEMFEHGWQKEYLELNLDLKSLVDETMLTFAVREIFTIIDGRIFDNRLVHPIFS
jgi:cation transport regulator ChaB